MFYSLHLAMLTTCCVLSLITGVYSLASGDTTVNIVVYVPKSYPYKNATVISAIQKEVKIPESEFLNWLGKLTIHYHLKLHV